MDELNEVKKEGLKDKMKTLWNENRVQCLEVILGVLTLIGGGLSVASSCIDRKNTDRLEKITKDGIDVRNHYDITLTKESDFDLTKKN